MSALGPRLGFWSRVSTVGLAALTTSLNAVMFGSTDGQFVAALPVAIASLAMLVGLILTASGRARPGSVVVTPSELRVESEAGAEVVPLADVADASESRAGVLVLRGTGERLLFGRRLPDEVRALLAERVEAGARACRAEDAPPPRDLARLARRGREGS